MEIIKFRAESLRFFVLAFSSEKSKFQVMLKPLFSKFMTILVGISFPNSLLNISFETWALNLSVKHKR